MTRWLTLHRDDIPLVIFTVASVGLATIVAINILNFYRVLMSDFLKVVGGGAVADGTRKHKLSEPVVDKSTKDETHMNRTIDTTTVTTSAATENLVEKIREATYIKKDAYNEGTANGFHPISKDVNKIMTSFFSNEVMDDFDTVSEDENLVENKPRHRIPTFVEKDKDVSQQNVGLSTDSKKDD